VVCAEERRGNLGHRKGPAVVGILLKGPGTNEKREKGQRKYKIDLGEVLPKKRQVFGGDLADTKGPRTKKPTLGEKECHGKVEEDSIASFMRNSWAPHQRMKQKLLGRVTLTEHINNTMTSSPERRGRSLS